MRVLRSDRVLQLHEETGEDTSELDVLNTNLQQFLSDNGLDGEGNNQGTLYIYGPPGADYELVEVSYGEWIISPSTGLVIVMTDEEFRRTFEERV
jgi:hypothetical protein